MVAEYFTVFMIGFLVGFSHCLTYSLKIREDDSSKSASGRYFIRAHLLYNSGRVFTYTIMGEIFGLLGSTIGFILAIKNLQGILELFAGCVMLVMGLDFAGLWPGRSADSFPGVNQFKKWIQKLYKNLNPQNLFLLGMILGWIPCGLVYAAGAQAVATQSMLGGMMTMLFFGLGTIPALFLVGLSTDYISVRLRQRLYRLAALALVLLAVITMLRGIDSLGWYHFYWLF
jgi:sulfite exporter TauE/SafE